MNLTWHIMRKDLFRLRWILLLWIVMLAGQLALGDIHSAVAEEGFSAYYWITFIFGRLFLPVMSFGLVMGLQDDDPVCDTDAFWITRPISSDRLLTAKAGLMVLLWLLPMLITTPWWLLHGYGADQLGSAAWRLLKVQFTLTLLALPLAVISPNGSRFVMNGILAAAGFLFLELIYWLGHAVVHIPATGAAIESLCWVLIALWVAGAVAMTLIQYYRRRTKLAMMVAAMVVLAGFTACVVWNWDLRPQRPQTADPEQAPNFSLEFLSVVRLPDQTESPATEPRVITEFQVRGLRAGEAVVVGTVVHHFQWSDGTESVAAPPPSEDPLVPACVDYILGPADEPVVRSTFRLPVGMDVRLRREAPRYSVAITGKVSRLEIVAEVPVKIGAKSVRNGASVRIDYFVPFLQFQQGLVIPVSEARPVFPPVMPAWFLPRPPPPDPEFYFLVNRGDGRVLQAHVGRGGADLSSDPLDVATLRYSRATLTFTPGQMVRGTFPDDLRTWLGKATLVKVIAHPASSFSLTAGAPLFEIPRAQAATEKLP